MSTVPPCYHSADLAGHEDATVRSEAQDSVKKRWRIGAGTRYVARPQVLSRLRYQLEVSVDGVQLEKQDRQRQDYTELICAALQKGRGAVNEPSGGIQG